MPKPEASVLDIFDVSRDDPFERAQMSAIDDMAELRDVLEKSQTPPSEEKSKISVGFVLITAYALNHLLEKKSLTCSAVAHSPSETHMCAMTSAIAGLCCSSH